MIKRKTHTQVYHDEWLDFYQDEIEFPNGSQGTYAWGTRQDGALVVVVTEDRKILLQREFRYPVQQFSWEIPGGGVEPDEEIEQAVVRELEEETGLRVTPDKLQKIGVFYPLSSLSTENGSVFMIMIDHAEVHAANSEASEIIDDHGYFSFEEVYQMIDDGRITDAFTSNAVQLAIRKFENDRKTRSNTKQT